MLYSRGYASGRFALELDGTNAGWLYGYEGGLASRDVVRETYGEDHEAHPHLGNITYSDIELSCGMGMARTFYRWVADSFGGRQHSRRNGALLSADFNLRERVRLTFLDALLTELELPACDASASEAMRLRIKLAPESTRLDPGDARPGRSIAGSEFPIDSARGKRWLTRNFRVRIDQMPDCLRRASKLDAIKLTQKIIEVPFGEFHEPHREPARTEYSDIVVSLPECDAGPLFRWYDEVVIRGRCDKELTGQVEFLADDARTAVCTVNLYGLGLYKVSADPADCSSEKIRQVRATMYCQKMTLIPGDVFA